MTLVPSVMRWVLRCVATLGRDVRGGMALVGAAGTAALLIAVAGGLQLSQRLSTYQIAQDALDEAALFAAASTTNDPNQLRSIAETVFVASLANTPAADARVTSFTYDATNRLITVTATGLYSDAMSRVVSLGNPTYQVRNQTYRRGYSSLELVLVLDTTFSMSVPAAPGDPAKINVLRGAAKDLVSTVLALQSPGAVQIGVVPYTETVNVGQDTTGSWLTIPPPVDYCMVNNVMVGAAACGPTQVTSTQCDPVTAPCMLTSDGVAYSSTCTTTPTTCAGGRVQQVTVQPVKWTLKFFGCVSALANGNTLLMPDPGVPYVGKRTNGVQCPEQIQPLTTDQALVQSAIAGLSVTNIYGYKGDTYIPQGLIWGVNVLSSTQPYTEGLPYDPLNRRPHKVMILMTDGQNDYALNSAGVLVLASPGPDLIRTYADQMAVCTYAKARGIEIYTIGFGVDGTSATGAQSLSALRTCATDNEHYFDATNAAALTEDFAIIANRLSVVRIAK